MATAIRQAAVAQYIRLRITTGASDTRGSKGECTVQPKSTRIRAGLVAA